MEPSVEQIECVVARCRHVLDLAKRNNVGISGKEVEPHSFVLIHDLSRSAASLILELQAWTEFDTPYLGDLFAAKGTLLKRSQQILDTYGSKPIELHGEGVYAINTPGGKWPEIPGDCLADIEFWLGRLEAVLTTLCEPVAAVESDESEPMWDGVPVRCFHADNDMSKPLVTVKYIDSVFAINGVAITKAWNAHKLTKRMPTTRKTTPYAYLWSEVESLANARNADSDES